MPTSFSFHTPREIQSPSQTQNVAVGRSDPLEIGQRSRDERNEDMDPVPLDPNSFGDELWCFAFGNPVRSRSNIFQMKHLPTQRRFKKSGQPNLAIFFFVS